VKNIKPASNILSFNRGHEFFFRLALKYAMRRDFAAALKYVDTAIEQDAFNADYLFNKACVLVELKKTKESIKVLNSIIWKIDPTYAECYFGLGCNYFELGDFHKALFNFEKYVMMEDNGEFFEDAYEILFYMQITSHEEFDYDIGDRLAARTREVRRLRSSSMKFHADGSASLFSGSYKDAIRKFEKAIIAFPELSSARVRLSMAYYMTGQLKLATALAGSALKVQKSNYMAKLCLALYYSVDGRGDMSEQTLRLLERMRSRKCGKDKVKDRLKEEDHVFYERMLSGAPVGDELKRRLEGVSRKLSKPSGV
jgi:tetratricopeptide (TPR) repeat protein